MKDYLNVTIWAYKTKKIKFASTIKYTPNSLILNALLTNNGLATQNNVEGLD
jgi:hypothetical protein